MSTLSDREPTDSRRRPGRRPAAVLMVAAILVVSGLAAWQALPLVAQGNGADIIVRYALPGCPMHVAAQSPERIWFTMPDDGLVGECLIAPDGTHSVITHTVAAGVTPWDIAYADGAVWYTSRDGSQIGSIDVASGESGHYAASAAPPHDRGTEPLAVSGQSVAPQPDVESDVSTPWSQSGSCLDVRPGTPTTLWFTRPDANQLARMIVTDTVTYDLTYYDLPPEYGDALPQDVAIADSATIWFTAPGAARIVQFSAASERFRAVLTGASSLPWSIDVHGATPWFTDPVGNRLACYNPTTMALVYWRTLPQADSGPFDLVVADDRVWFSEWTGQRAGILNAVTWGELTELSVGADTTLAGVAADSSGRIWLASDSDNSLLCWRAPYYHAISLPLALSE